MSGIDDYMNNFISPHMRNKIEYHRQLGTLFDQEETLVMNSYTAHEEVADNAISIERYTLSATTIGFTPTSELVNMQYIVHTSVLCILILPGYIGLYSNCKPQQYFRDHKRKIL